MMCDEVIKKLCDKNCPKKTFPTKATPTKTIPPKITPTKTVPTSFNRKKVSCKVGKVGILLAFLLISIALLIAVSIYCYLKNY